MDIRSPWNLPLPLFDRAGRDKAEVLLCCCPASFYGVVTCFWLPFINQPVKISTENMKREENPELVLQAYSPSSEKYVDGAEQLEAPPASIQNLVYDHDDEEPEIHTRTYLAVMAMLLLNMVQVLALQGPPAVVSTSRKEAYKAWLGWAGLTRLSFPTLAMISTTQPRRLGYLMPSHLCRQWCLRQSPQFQTRSKFESIY